VNERPRIARVYLQSSLASSIATVSATRLELELIQTQMTQKPMLRAEVYARALRASQNRKEDSLKSSYVLTSESGGRATHTVIELSFHLESNVALATRNRFSSGLAPLLELN
jgi:hypothetical protein